MQVLVTGIAGFIGSHVAERLVARGDRVIGVDNFDPFYARSVKEINLAEIRDSIELYEGDIVDPDLLERVFSTHPFDAVVHLAALAGVRPSLAEPWRYQHVNVTGTARLIDAMVKHRVKRLTFASSSSVYGDNTTLPFREDHRIDDPASPYAASKRAGELLLLTLHKAHDLNVSNLRYFTVYGPRQRPEMAIAKFCNAVERGEEVTMFGDGSSSRDYTFIDDIADGTVLALDKAPDGYQTYNLGNTTPISLSALIDKIGEAVGKKPNVKQLPLQTGDVAHTLADVSAAKAALGYAPTTPIEEGLRKYVNWMRRAA